MVIGAAVGINNGATSGNGSGAGAGAGAAFFFLVFFGFLLAAHAPRMQHKRPSGSNHCQMGRWNPEEPELLNPELPRELEESLAGTPVLREPEFKDSEGVPLEPEDESHGVCVVVVFLKVETMVFVTVAACAMPARPSKRTAVVFIMAERRPDCKRTQNP